VTSDVELLQAYAPALHYTHGELFFPAAVESYLPECDLFVGRSGRDRNLLVPVGELSEESLTSFQAKPGETLSMRLVQHPMGSLELARWNRRPDRPAFHAPSRLTRVGLFARLVDSGFTVSLLLRGSVPGGTTAAASVKYEAVKAHDPRFVYHGRVVRRDGWIVLHYLYFYFMNDWRSTFAGANDHESDWSRSWSSSRTPPTARIRSGSPVLRMTTRAMSSAGAGMIRPWSRTAITRSSTLGPAHMPPTSRPANI
jgi:hypothetical protein